MQLLAGAPLPPLPPPPPSSLLLQSPTHLPSIAVVHLPRWYWNVPIVLDQSNGQKLLSNQECDTEMRLINQITFLKIKILRKALIYA